MTKLKESIIYATIVCIMLVACSKTDSPSYITCHQGAPKYATQLVSSFQSRNVEDFLNSWTSDDRPTAIDAISDYLPPSSIVVEHISFISTCVLDDGQEITFYILQTHSIESLATYQLAIHVTTNADGRVTDIG